MDRDQLVSQLYEYAAADEGDFAGLLAQLANLLRAPYAHLFVVGERGGLAESHFFGYDGAPFADYEAHWRERDPRFALGLANTGRMLSDVEHIDPASFERSEVYNDFLRPVGVRYTLFGQVGLDGGLTAAQAFMRDRRAGPFEAEEVRDATLLLPHLRRALDLRRLVHRCKRELADLRAALDLVPTPLALVDADGKVLCASASAERLFGVGDGLRLRDQRMTADVTKTQHALTAAIACTARFADAPSRRNEPFPPPAVVQVPRSHGPPLALLFLPLRPRSTLRDAGEVRGRVLVVLDDPATKLTLDPALLRELYPLTPVEARLAIALAKGRSLADFAEEQGCSEGTARTHLKRVLEKTETHRQAELVHALLSRVAMRFVAGVR